ncbi:MAG: hypothetical protein JWR55_2008 [Aeromicrobium sp.]|jgi:hypothetical protein|nr:hypothetical protein [Aeromicrobium sp.]
MTSRGPSPPRSEKESSAASEVPSEPVVETTAGAVAPPSVPSTQAVEQQAAEQRRAVKKQARRARSDAKETARRAKHDAKLARIVRRGRGDGIVEAPREPKAPASQRLRQALSRRSDDVPAPRSSAAATRRRIVSVLAGVLGAVGLVCSVVLAVGTLLVALGADGGTFYDTVSRTCDVLVGPLRDVFSFSGTNAAMKESLVAWGAGSIGYLVVGIVAQSLLRATVDD